MKTYHERKTENNEVFQFSSVVSDYLRPHESQHARPPCPSPPPGVQPDSRPSSQWCHPAISSSVVPFSSCPQSLPASESFPMSQLFAWGGQSTVVLLEWKKGKTSDWSMWVCSKYKVLPAAIFKDSSIFFFNMSEMEITISKRAKRKVKDFQRSDTFWVESLNIIVIKELKMDF